MAFRFLIFSLAVSAAALLSPVSGQITMPCTPSMITTFSPCMNFLTNSSVNSTAPPAACCNSLKSLMSNGRDCLCLITSGSMPFRIPINQSLAISLPRACNMSGVPLQCKAAGAPVPAPAPGPVANGPSVSPNAAPSPSVNAAEPVSPGQAPQADATPTPPAPTTTGGAPTSNTGSRAGVTPSAAHPSYSISLFHIMAVVGAIALKYY
ncbi:UNVERIFIED_CONTAM: hypothetical protein Scaly_0782100 [Sesamum calycinum]|uniref:Bifunctional inhibitor/plant lipid transfer protein/seed storage helical domain-containing protein n=1 Tax=Sesamum calycinum TaxID=2727403 RepID=A0AAW2R960_9LAMI